eukprot:5874572-Heterocapsa_arctica.AAC.1
MLVRIATGLCWGTQILTGLHSQRLQARRNTNGFEEYRRFLHEYEPREVAQYAAMLVGVMTSRWSGKLSEFADEFREWELVVQRYEEATRVSMLDEVEYWVIATHAPRAIQSYLRVSDIDLLQDYADLRLGIFEFLMWRQAF